MHFRPRVLAVVGAGKNKPFGQQTETRRLGLILTAQRRRCAPCDFSSHTFRREPLRRCGRRISRSVVFGGVLPVTSGGSG